MPPILRTFLESQVFICRRDASVLSLLRLDLGGVLFCLKRLKTLSSPALMGGIINTSLATLDKSGKTAKGVIIVLNQSEVSQYNSIKFF